MIRCGNQLHKAGPSVWMAGILLCIMLMAGAAGAQETFHKMPPTAVDLSKDRALYLIGYSHLDTQWCWTYPQVIREFIPNTLHENFRLFEKYPNYVFNWTGSNRYRFMKEYYPEDYAKLKQYIASGQWFPNGSSIEEGDVNNPSSESLIRQVLYGNEFFRKEFGKESSGFMLPDCFGFPASLPSILAHCGLNGFSTQKLTWGSAVGIPFNVGNWVGPDGQSVIAALNPGDYTGSVNEDMSSSPSWEQRLDEDKAKSGVAADYHYYGVGDRGGAPREGSVQWVERSVSGKGPIKVISARADQLFNDLTPAEVAKLPRYTGDLLLTQHSAGSLTSEAMMKRWNRKNELLADETERACVAADWLGAAPYPRQRITDAWERFLPGQFHDLLAGTALPKAYEYSWNDEVLAMNEFASELQEAAGGVARGLDTRGRGIPLVVYNPLSIPREDVVEASVLFPGEAPMAVQVFGPNGKAVPAQVVGRDGSTLHILFLARVPSVGFATYDVRPARSAATVTAGLAITNNSLENARYRLKLNADGDVSSIFDKTAGKEILAGPARLAFQYENPGQYPAWNMDWNDQRQPPRAYVTGPAMMKIVEKGPVRVALQVERESQGSRFVQTIRLASGGAGNRVEFATQIDWKSKESALKAVFPLTVTNPNATYNWGLGTVERANDDPRKYEVPSHQWFDLTDKGGAYGVSILEDCKNGSDKPDDNTLRLTLLYTPGVRGGFQHQATQDWGHHEMIYAVEGHRGDWRQGDSQWEGARLNQPLVAFQAPAHPGQLGRSFSLAHVDQPQVQIEAIKKAEDSSEVVVRLFELAGKSAQHVHLAFAAPIIAAREVNGQEKPVGAATVENGQLVFDMQPYRPRAFALKLGAAPVSLPAPGDQSVTLPFNQDVASSTAHPTDGDFDGQGRTIPGDLLPAAVQCGGVTFRMGPTADGQKNAVVCKGQTIPLPAGAGQRLYLLAAAVGGDTPATFHVDGKPVTLTIQDWGGYIGQWDYRLWKGQVPELTYGWSNPMAGLMPGYIKRAPVAWYADHHRLSTGQNDPYSFCYLFRYEIDLPAGAHTLMLPQNDRVRVLAATVARDPNAETWPAQPLYDVIDRSGGSPPQIQPQGGQFHDSTLVSIDSPFYTGSGGIHYTLDGSDPGPTSAVFTTPFLLSHSATIRARSIDLGGHQGPVSSVRLDVHDTTPPSIESISTTGFTPEVKVVFSEPVAKAGAEDAGNYTLQPAAAVQAATLSIDGRSVTLRLAQPLPRDGKYTLAVKNVQDLAPAPNSIPPGTSKLISVAGAVYQQEAVQTFVGRGRGVTVPDVKNLPVGGSDPWSLNMFVYTDEEPGELSILGGFGSAEDTTGAQRYLIKFHGGIHFWGSNVDIDAGQPFDLKKWQMVTVTYDGKTLRIYKDGQEIKSSEATLVDAEPVVKMGARGPWQNGRRFMGKIAGFSIWNLALPPDAIRGLLAGKPAA